MRPNLTYSTKSTNILYVTPSYEWGLRLRSKNSLCENNAHICAHHSWTFECDTCIIIPIYQVIIFLANHFIHWACDNKEIHPPLDFQRISSYLGDDAMMLPQCLTFVSEFEEVLSLSESQGSWGSEMQLDKFWHFYLVLGPTLGVNICNFDI